jgi:hypothetical protein
MTSMLRRTVHSFVIGGCILLIPSGARAQVVLKANDSVSVRFGFLSQTWADFTQNVRQDSSYAQSIFERRLRFIMGVQVGSHLSFFFQTDNPNLGRSGPGFTKTLGAGFITQDAYVEVKPGASNALLLDAGLQYVPFCRNCMESAATILPMDLGAYSYLQNAGTASSGGRDVGFVGRGYLFGDRLEYRAGVFSGARLSTAPGVQTATNSLRGAGRLQLQLLDPEAPAYSYPGNYFGRKKVLSVGAALDAQSSYRAIVIDGLLSLPVGGDGITAQANFIHYDGRELIPALPKQDTFEAEAGYHFNGAKLTPWAKFEMRSYDEAVQSALFQGERRVQVGGTWYVSGSNLNLKAGYGVATLDRLGQPALTQNGVTFQLQAYYY